MTDCPDSEELLAKTVLHSEYHFGGYANYNLELIKFIQDFNRKYKIPLDQVYTGKVMYALFSEMEKGNLDNQTIVFIHTGGIQGTKFLEEKEGLILNPTSIINN